MTSTFRQRTVIFDRSFSDWQLHHGVNLHRFDWCRSKNCSSYNFCSSLPANFACREKSRSKGKMRNEQLTHSQKENNNKKTEKWVNEMNKIDVSTCSWFYKEPLETTMTTYQRQLPPQYRRDRHAVPTGFDTGQTQLTVRIQKRQGIHPFRRTNATDFNRTTRKRVHRSQFLSSTEKYCESKLWVAVFKVHDNIETDQIIRAKL